MFKILYAAGVSLDFRWPWCFRWSTVIKGGWDAAQDADKNMWETQLTQADCMNSWSLLKKNICELPEYWHRLSNHTGLYGGLLSSFRVSLKWTLVELHLLVLVCAGCCENHKTHHINAIKCKWSHTQLNISLRFQFTVVTVTKTYFQPAKKLSSRTSLKM